MVPISSHIRRLREKVGHDLLVLPSTAVLPRDEAGRLLLVRLSDTGNWALIGGAVEPDESPQECAIREAHEEAGVQVELGPVVGVFGGAEYRVTYPNGDETAYVVTAIEATVVGGDPRPDHDETTEVAWFSLDDLPLSETGPLGRALLRDVGYLAPRPVVRRPLLVIVTGLQGTGKSTVAEAAVDHLRAVALSHDWAMSGLRPHAEVQAALNGMDPPGHGVVGWSLLSALARSQLRTGKSVVLDGMARAPQMDLLRRLAEEEGAGFVAIMTECSDPDLHRSRVENRDRGIPDWYELEWSQVERSRQSWVPELSVDLRLDTAVPLRDNLDRLSAFLGGEQGRADSGRWP